LHDLADYLEPVALLSRLFVLPGINSQAALHKYGTPFFCILARDFREASPEFDINVCHLLHFFAALIGVGPIDREPDVCDGATLWSVFDLRIAGDIPDEHHFVEASHFLISYAAISAVFFF
jgi:hypothetical protein